MRKGLSVKTLAEICEFKSVTHKGDLPYVGMENVESHTGRFLGSLEKQRVKSSTRYFDSSYVLYGKLRPYLNKVLVPNFEGHCSSEFLTLKPNAEISREYLGLWLRSDSVVKEMSQRVTGARMPRADLKHFKTLMISFPSLSEQRRIVKILDEKFDAIDKLKKVTEKQLVDVKELFDSSLEETLINSDKEWDEKKLGELCEVKGRIGYRGYTKNDLVSEGEGAITLSPSNIRNNEFNTENCTYISWFKYDESPEIMVYEGDILFVKTGSTYGKVALVEVLPEKATINPQFVVLKNINCNNRFLYYSLTTKKFKSKVEGIVGGAATPTLSQTNLAEQTVLVPSTKVQISVTQKLDILRNKTQKLKKIYQEKLTNLEELKKSYLEEAFAGNL